MNSVTVSRRQRRELQQRQIMFSNMKKGTALFSTAIIGCGVMVPLLNPVKADAESVVQASSGVNTAAFISEISTYAQTVANANDLYASVMIAQAICESGWGTSALSKAPNYNLFGIKGSYQGQTVYMDTWEYLNSQWVTKKEAFRKYPSYAESFYDNAYVLRNVSFQSGVYFYSGTWKSNTSSYRDATAWLTGRYATDPSYNVKLNNIIQTYNLTRFDTPATGNSGGGATTPGDTTGGDSGSTGSGTDSGTTTNEYYTVKSGDTIWSIANRHGISMSDLRSWNGLSGDTIYVGQQLIIGKGSSSSSNSGSNSGSGSSTDTGSSNGSSSSTGGTYYTVKSGDTIWAISNKHGISMSDLRSWNSLSGDTIYVGQQLLVSKSGSSSSSNTSNGSSGSTGSTSTTGGTYYTVKSGDTVWAVSNKYGISTSDLRSWNSLSGDTIYVGQQLLVSKSSSSSNTSNGSSGSTGSTSTTGGTYYTVKSGDTVWAVSNKYGISTSDLRSWNSLSGDTIYVGQQLLVSKSGSSSSSSNNNSSATNTGSSSTSGGSYTVKSGDTIWGISTKHGISVSNLRSWNNLSNDTIYVGQKLVVSQSGATNSTSSSSTTSNTGNTSSSNSTSSASTDKEYYTVKSGDTVWSITQKHSISLSDFRNWNNLSNDLITVGQKVIVGEKETASASYTVKSGDTLWSIAQKNNLSLSKLKELNNLTSDAISVGQSLKVK